MENTDKKVQKTLKSDKDYFSAYLNMARHNAWLILARFSEKLGKNAPSEDGLTEAYAITVLNDIKNADVSLKSIEYLNQHFPFLKIMFDKDIKRDLNKEKEDANYKKTNENIPEQYYNAIRLILKELSVYRNYYTHTIHEPIIINHRFINYLISIFDASVRKVKENFKMDDKDLEHLRRYSNRKGEDGKAMLKTDFKYNFYDDSNISEKGLAFFISIFLEKKYAFEFLKRLNGFKDSRTKEMQATLETYCIYNIRIPKERIDSTKSDLSLSMDIFNELKKCPGELFGLLNKEDANKFREIVDVENPELNEYYENVVLKRNDNRFPYFTMRYIDEEKIFSKLRFHIDLGNYYFKFCTKTTVDGEQHDRSFKIHLKSFGRLEELNMLRLEQWKSLIKFHSDEEESIPIEKMMPYISDTFPHYHLNNNQIGLKIVNDSDTILPKLNKEKTKTEQPDFWLSIYEMPALLFYCYLTKDSKENNPAENLILNCKRKYISFFKIITNCQNLEEIKQKITLINNKKNIKENGNNKEIITTFAQFKDDNNNLQKLDFSDIPDIFVQYLTGNIIQNFNIRAEAKVNRLIEETSQRIKKIINDLQQLNDNRNKIGKKKFIEIKSGILADFISKDIMMFQPSADIIGKDKITGLNYQVLQSRLAFYGRDRELLNNIFKKCKLTESNIKHPFLEKINPEDHFDFVSFYKAYLNERTNYLKKCLKDKDFNNYYFLKPNKLKNKSKDDKYFKTLAKKMINQNDKDNIPINLPRGLFMDAIVEWFKNNGSDKMKEVVNSEKANTVYLIQKYFEIERNLDKHQSFYDFKRSYEFIDKLHNNRERNKRLIREYYTTMQLIDMIEKIKRQIDVLPEYDARKNSHPRKKMKAALWDFKQNEKLIRFYKAQDMVLFLIAREILFKQIPEGIEEKNMKLSYIKPKPETGSDKDLLSLQIPFSLKYNYFSVDNKGKIDNKNKLGTITILQEDLKLKNYGDFIRFTKDRRLNNLFHWTGNIKNINRNVLQKELERFEETRLIIFNNVHFFEKALYDKHKSYFDNILTDLETKHKKIYIEHKEMLDKFFKDYPSFSKYRSIMENLRNRFSHNQYPEKCIFENTDINELLSNYADIEANKNNELNVALYFKNISNATYRNFAEMLINNNI